MNNIFYISDLHFGHNNIVTFLKEDGTKLRPWSSVDEMHEVIKSNWNSVVKQYDKVYVLGDVVINKKAFHHLKDLNGKKILIRGNHDIFDLKCYAEHFKDVRGYHVNHNFVLSHMPIHEESVRRFKVNIHGHMHAKNVMKGDQKDPRYINVSVEQIDYTPIEHSVIMQQISALV